MTQMKYNIKSYNLDIELIETNGADMNKCFTVCLLHCFVYVEGQRT